MIENSIFIYWFLNFVSNRKENQQGPLLCKIRVKETDKFYSYSVNLKLKLCTPIL